MIHNQNPPIRSISVSINWKGYSDSKKKWDTENAKVVMLILSLVTPPLHSIDASLKKLGICGTTYVGFIIKLVSLIEDYN